MPATKGLAKRSAAVRLLAIGSLLFLAVSQTPVSVAAAVGVGPTPESTVLAQSNSMRPSWATAGNWFAWSVSSNESAPGVKSSLTNLILNLTVQSVTGTSVTLLESSGAGNSTASFDLNSPIPPESNSTYFYIPPAQLQSTLSGLATTLMSSLAFPKTGFANTSTVSMRKVGTSLGDVNTWTLEASSKSTTQSESAFQGQATASLSYDSQLGLLMVAQIKENGTFSGQQSGPASLSIDIALTGRSPSVHLTPAGSSGTPEVTIIAVTAVTVAAITVAVSVALMKRGNSSGNNARAIARAKAATADRIPLPPILRS